MLSLTRKYEDSADYGSDCGVSEVSEHKEYLGTYIINSLENGTIMTNISFNTVKNLKFEGDPIPCKLTYDAKLDLTNQKIQLKKGNPISDCFDY